MITPIDCVCMQIIAAEDTKADAAHYHLATPPDPHPGDMVSEANFHLINRAIKMDQIGFDYYYNVLTYRV